VVIACRVAVALAARVAQRLGLGAHLHRTPRGHRSKWERSDAEAMLAARLL